MLDYIVIILVLLSIFALLIYGMLYISGNLTLYVNTIGCLISIQSSKYAYGKSQFTFDLDNGSIIHFYSFDRTGILKSLQYNYFVVEYVVMFPGTIFEHVKKPHSILPI